MHVYIHYLSLQIKMYLMNRIIYKLQVNVHSSLTVLYIADTIAIVGGLLFLPFTYYPPCTIPVL